MEPKQVLVNRKAFKELMKAFLGPDYLVRELAVLAKFPNTPLNVLIQNYIEILKAEEAEKKEVKK